MSDYVELHCHSNFSLLDGADQPETLVARAAELGWPTLALTDHDALYGAVRFAQAARLYGLRPIFGAEITLTNGHHLTLLVEREPGWRNLCRIISQARHNAPKGQAAFPAEELPPYAAGLIALSGCKQGEIAAALLAKDDALALNKAQHYRAIFGPENFWLELQHHLLPADSALIHQQVALAKQVGLGYVATNNVHYATRSGQRLQDVLVCIRHLTRLTEAGDLLRPNSEYYLKSARQLKPLFPDYPEALSHTWHIAERCQFELPDGLQPLPRFPIPNGLAPDRYLRQLCEQALPRYYADPPDRVGEQLSHELNIINRAGLANYFLIVWDLVRFAREQGIRGQGRGSAANSLVAYLLGISPIDPLAHDLVFERFLSAERQVVPDIDLDFQADRREEVIQYLYHRYGPDQTAMACTFVTFRQRSAVRDVGRALGLPLETLAQGSRLLEDTVDYSADPISRLRELCAQIDGFPRHLGIHNGGMVIMGRPLADRLPTEPATMPDRVVVQWDKEALEAAGLVKIDVLGLRMLSAIDEAERWVEAQCGQSPALSQLTFDDPVVYARIARADTLGVFQVESRAQSQMLPRLKPRCFADLVVAISLIRPGPIQGNMVHPYLRRRLGQEAVTYAHPLLEPALAETLGVILFQEQVLKVARDLAGFTAGQGELLRRALGSKRGEQAMVKLRDDFLAGATANNIPAEVAETVFGQLQAFGGYSFAKSHAAAFAVLVYQSAWLKQYHPAAFYTGLLNNQPMGFWSPAVLVGDAKRHGLAILPVDLDSSQTNCSIEGQAIRLGFNYVNGLGEVQINRLLAARQAGGFKNLADFCRRTKLARRLVERLILAGAMDRWQLPRRTLLWQLGQLPYQAEELDLTFPIDEIHLPPLSPAERLQTEHSVLGLSSGEQVMSLYRTWLSGQGILGSWELSSQGDGQRVRVAGLVVVHQAPPTAKGFHFVTLEDEAGLIDVIVRPQMYARYRLLWRDEPLLIVEGQLQQEGAVVTVLASSVIALRGLEMSW